VRSIDNGLLQKTFHVLTDHLTVKQFVSPKLKWNWEGNCFKFYLILKQVNQYLCISIASLGVFIIYSIDPVKQTLQLSKLYNQFIDFQQE